MIALLGTGMMGEALLAGLLKAGTDPATIRTVDARADRAAEIADRYGVWSSTGARAVAGADAVIVAVKPPDVPGLLDEMSAHLSPACLVISIAAGLPVAKLEAHLPAGQPVVRAMPNTPALVGQGMTAITPGSSATAEHLAYAGQILGAVGRVARVAEKDMDTVTALSGSGPAYLLLFAEAMIDAGVLLGLPRTLAGDLVKQTLYGTSALLRDSGEHPTILKENVVSPGGTTAAALRVFEEHAFKAMVAAAVEACHDRSAELGRKN